MEEHPSLQPGDLPCDADEKDMSWKLQRVELPGDGGSPTWSIQKTTFCFHKAWGWLAHPVLAGALAFPPRTLTNLLKDRLRVLPSGGAQVPS